MATDMAVLEHGEVGNKVMNQSNGHDCCKSGPGYATPLEAMSGPRETLIYVTAVYSGTKKLLFLLSYFCVSASMNMSVQLHWRDRDTWALGRYMMMGFSLC